MCFNVNTSPREGSNGTPLRVLKDFFSVAVEHDKPRRAKAEITCPAVPPSRCANSLAACKTSSSMSKVVLKHLMLLHQNIKVKPLHLALSDPYPLHFVVFCRFCLYFTQKVS